MRADGVSLLFPPKCVACGKLLDFQGFGEKISALCDDCEKLWRSELLESCGVCGQAVSICKCVTEDMHSAHCDGLFKRVYYIHSKSTPVQNRIIYKIKNQASRRTVAFLTEELEGSLRLLMKEECLDPAQTVLTYFPRRRSVVAQTGTDQGKQLAQALSRQTGLRMYPVLKRRFRKEREQKNLNRVQRRQNARDTYELVNGALVKGMNVILVDDIVTTGATMAAGTKLLRRAGAVHVYGLAVAEDDANKNAGMKQPVFHI